VLVDSSGPAKDRFSRVFDVLELLVGHADGLTLTDISRRLQLPTSSTHNLLQKMVANEMLSVTSDLRYFVGARAVRLSLRITEGLEVRNIARRYLNELSLETGSDVYLGMGLGRKVSYVDRAQGTNSVSVAIRLGQPLYLHATAVGKLYSSYIEAFRAELMSQPKPELTDFTLVDRESLEVECAKIRLQEYAISREEAFLGIIGIAVPVCDAGGNLVAALHLPLLQNNFSDESLTFLLSRAQASAAAIESELGRIKN
jgi:DNA-binding IclR family transcriptional regulator